MDHFYLRSEEKNPDACLPPVTVHWLREEIHPDHVPLDCSQGLEMFAAFRETACNAGCL